MKEIQIAAGCKTRIIRRRFSSLATTYTFNASPTHQDAYLTETVEIKGSNWIFPKPVKRISLQSSNKVIAGVWDTFFSVYVSPEVDIVITVPSKSFGWLLRMTGLGIVAVAIAVLLLT